MTDVRFTSDIKVRLVQKAGGDHMVVAAARVSVSGEDAIKFADPELNQDNYGFINYLTKNRHGSPFEHSLLTFFIHAPAFVWWEWVRHRVGHSYNLESSRYKKLEPVFWIPRKGRKITPDAGHKSARPKFREDEQIRGDAQSLLERSYIQCYRDYERMIEKGVANEVARAVLPFAVYFSGWVTVNPRSLMSFLSLRTHDPDAMFVSRPQAEIEEAARIAESIFADGWPLTHKSFCENGRVAP